VEACNEDGIWNEAGSTLDLIVQPPFWQNRWFLLGSGFSVVAIVLGTVYLTATQRLRRRLRHQESLEKERSRIARDLHDQLGANLTQITLLGEMNVSDKELPGEVEINSQQICQTARETTRALDEIVWAANPANDSLEGLANYACKYAQDYFALAGLRYRTDVPAQLPAIPLPPDVRHNAFLAFKEAVNNVVKHAQATEAQVHLKITPRNFVLIVTDNGRGLGDRPAAAKTRNGLKNMRKRMEDIKGGFDIAPAPNGGTVVELTVPLVNND
jgi:signal transduction histidine kinase